MCIRDSGEASPDGIDIAGDTQSGDAPILGDAPISGDARILFEALAAKDERKSGNIKLQRELDWTDERYVRAKEELVDRGLAVVGTGRGGSLRLASAGSAADAGETADEA